MTLTTILIFMSLKYIGASMPQWKRGVNAWIKDDMDGFLKFKEEVFTIVDSSKKGSKNDGFEIIHPNL